MHPPLHRGHGPLVSGDGPLRQSARDRPRDDGPASRAPPGAGCRAVRPGGEGDGPTEVDYWFEENLKDLTLEDD